MEPEKDYGDMPLEDFTHGIYKNIMSIKWGVWILTIIEALKLLTQVS